MKSLLSLGQFTLSGTVIALLSLPVHGQTMNLSSTYTSNLEIKAAFLAEDHVPDGNPDKELWKSTTWIHFDHNMSGRLHHPQAETRVAALWSMKYVYFAFKCHYTSLNIFEGEDPAKERWELWTRDVAEVFINPEPERVNHYYEFEVAPNNQWIDLEIDKTKTPFNDAAWDSHFDHAARVDSQNHVWTCEMRLPVGSMGVQDMRPAMEWRVNFYRMDGTGDYSQRRLMSWSPILEGDSFHVPTRFGILKFVQ